MIWHIPAIQTIGDLNLPILHLAPQLAHLELAVTVVIHNTSGSCTILQLVSDLLLVWIHISFNFKIITGIYIPNTVPANYGVTSPMRAAVPVQPAIPVQPANPQSPQQLGKGKRKRTPVFTNSDDDEDDEDDDPFCDDDGSSDDFEPDED